MNRAIYGSSGWKQANRDLGWTDDLWIIDAVRFDCHMRKEGCRTKASDHAWLTGVLDHHSQEVRGFLASIALPGPAAVVELLEACQEATGRRTGAAVPLPREVEIGSGVWGSADALETYCRNAKIQVPGPLSGGRVRVVENWVRFMESELEVRLKGCLYLPERCLAHVPKHVQGIVTERELRDTVDQWLREVYHRIPLAQRNLLGPGPVGPVCGAETGSHTTGVALRRSLSRRQR
jgi:hypothetical protein